MASTLHMVTDDHPMFVSEFLFSLTTYDLEVFSKPVTVKDVLCIL